jgi:hypothetical protein
MAAILDAPREGATGLAGPRPTRRSAAQGLKGPALGRGFRRTRQRKMRNGSGEPPGAVSL